MVPDLVAASCRRQQSLDRAEHAASAWRALVEVSAFASLCRQL